MAIPFGQVDKQLYHFHPKDGSFPDLSQAEMKDTYADYKNPNLTLEECGRRLDEKCLKYGHRAPPQLQDFFGAFIGQFHESSKELLIVAAQCAKKHETLATATIRQALDYKDCMEKTLETEIIALAFNVNRWLSCHAFIEVISNMSFLY